MCTSTPSVEAPAKLPEAPTMPEQRTGANTATRDRRRRATAAGRSGGTILTGASGLTANAGGTVKTLLGQ